MLFKALLGNNFRNGGKNRPYWQDSDGWHYPQCAISYQKKALINMWSVTQSRSSTRSLLFFCLPLYHVAVTLVLIESALNNKTNRYLHYTMCNLYVWWVVLPKVRFFFKQDSSFKISAKTTHYTFLNILFVINILVDQSVIPCIPLFYFIVSRNYL